MEMSGIFTCVLIGLVSGLIAALCGVGGGLIMVPAFVAFLGMSQKNAVATSMAAIILTSIAASTRNHSNNFIDWKVTLVTGASAAMIAWFAADLLKTLSNATLTKFFAITMILMGARMLWTATHEPPAKNPNTPTEVTAENTATSTPEDESAK